VPWKRTALIFVFAIGTAPFAGHPAGKAVAPFAGSASCARCHERESEAWGRSPHARHGIAVADPEGGAEGAIGSIWMQAYYRRDARGIRRIVPQCFSLRDRKWADVAEVLQAISGTDRAFTHNDVATRSFDHDCSGCHTSHARLSIDDASGRAGAHGHDTAINCESCHGASGAHVSAWSALKTDAPLKKLQSLSPRASSAICARCHGGPQASEDLGPDDARDHVGLLLDRAGLFADGAAAGQVYQYSSFVRSPCFTEGNLACAGCHDSHAGGLTAQPHADALCTRCHEEGYAQRSHTHHDPRGAGARCVECHMPKLLDGIMAHQRDHRIRSPLPASPHVPDACTACHKDRDKAWASKAYKGWWGEAPREDLDAIRGIELARRKSPAAKPLLRAALLHDDPFFRGNAGIYLGQPHALLKDESPEVRVLAVHASRKLARPEPALRLMLEDSEPLVRAAAMRELLVLGSKLEPEWEADLTALVRHDRDRHPVELLLARSALERGDRATARTLLERCVVNAAARPEEARPGIAGAWRLLAKLHDDAGRSGLARHAWRGLGRLHYDRWCGARWESDELMRAVGALVAGGDWERASRILDEELRLARGERERTTLRAMIGRLNATQEKK